MKAHETQRHVVFFYINALVINCGALCRSKTFKYKPVVRFIELYFMLHKL